jgi:hypothetical protein
MTIDYRTFGALQRRNNRRSTPIIVAYVNGPLPDPNMYEARLADTNGTVRFAGPINVTLEHNQAVLLARGDAAGRTINSGYIYVGLGPVLARNVTGVGDPDTDTDTYSSEIVTSIPEYVELTAGGASRTIHIYGKNLSTPPTYGDAEIDDASAQTITSTHITLVVSATIACNAGEYSLTVGGVTYPKFFRVTATLPDLADFSWVNQDLATATQANTRAPIIMSVAGEFPAASHNLSKAPASSSATVTMGIVPSMPEMPVGHGSTRCGMFVGNAAGNFLTLGLERAYPGSVPATGPFLRVERWFDPDDPDVTLYDGSSTTAYTSGSIFFRIDNDGTTLTFSWSDDGATFSTIYSETIATYLTDVASVGLFVSNQSGVGCSMSVYRWIEIP